MKQFFVIEADTEFYNVFVREVTQSMDVGAVRYEHKPDAKIVALGTPEGTLSRELMPLLITLGKKEAP